ncbi:hypothetical protein CDEST_15519 [Colletotrichum destructivum]|uniref:BZIP domain-containing protein n=1 Tax=Colletotrichum destructivum TaxID=34406 RepID=A0AAX4J4Q7_9PEZI|nr:hypothetical protein CDEST_15519 [Colletotrichum destructivum]
MALSQFRKLDVKSMKQLFEEKERKNRQRAEQKRRHEREEQQQQQKQAQLPSTALATLLGQTVGVLDATGAQTTSWTSADPFASIGNLDFDSGENLGIGEAYTQCDFASLGSTEPPCEIGGILSTMPKPTFADDINSHSPFGCLAHPFLLSLPQNEPLMTRQIHLRLRNCHWLLT